MKKVILATLCAISIMGCAKKTGPGTIYNYTIEYTNGEIKSVKSYSCGRGCDPNPAKLAVDSVMCDIAGNFYVQGGAEYHKQEGFKCKIVVTKEVVN